ncbi:thioesterase family protein [Arcobacter porcinus]|uniref:Thioesterase n=1 Tax=Arcobacter porcinus TaxID=1935204 RepID=A0A1C0AV88_9BACT|nr:thioesterase [Arcobacter porcinus]OCL94248.1 Fluoroacetyl-CoA thioesterase [Aliarcobacter thereius]OCL81950.1 Fluoroacetyl-CoA thioesterase [Arcobacter porcinus]OCL82026.1 Fluoroacetyl-CoA thioesterase [Arcobacter porcinus]OCL86203.1 Fluoroacetyl-CoA thioesterase [Arcobacter porcinus]OCL90342.1 Fluoroacetyl-CoA thioesterase [Arcobacter porcinus]
MCLEIGTKAEISYKVLKKDLAANLEISKDDGFPEVFATARMVALMECSAAKMMIPLLSEDELSVGVGVDIKHLAATLENDIAISTATFIGMEGKLYKFSIEVVDSGGVIGTGFHTRAIVNNDRLINGAKKRVQK